jgi:hypothetical protein
MATSRQVHALRFADLGRLSRAFEQLLAGDRVDYLLVDLDALRIRFIAAAEFARPLVERIYLDGGLRFASRHRIRFRRNRALALRR